MFNSTKPTNKDQKPKSNILGSSRIQLLELNETQLSKVNEKVKEALAEYQQNNRKSLYEAEKYNKSLSQELQTWSDLIKSWDRTFTLLLKQYWDGRKGKLKELKDSEYKWLLTGLQQRLAVEKALRRVFPLDIPEKTLELLAENVEDRFNAEAQLAKDEKPREINPANVAMFYNILKFLPNIITLQSK
jgi:hypothetical protein